MNGAVERELARVVPQLTDLFAAIAARTGSDAGITRDAYGPAETAAATILIDYAKGRGLDAGFDRVGNLNVTASGCFNRAPEIIIGSHLDSVPHGGNYDGLAGVVAGIGLLVALASINPAVAAQVRVVGFRGEESPWFGTAYLGSKLFTGQLARAEIDALRRPDTGKTLLEHLASIGVPSEALDGSPVVPLDRARAYLELHIEQGPLLEALGLPVGVATAIRGNIRHPLAKCFGQYAHSAAVPRELRCDALIATAKLIAFADERWRAEIEAGAPDTVFTCGIFATDAKLHAMTKVPGEVTFSINIGGTDDAVMGRLHAGLMGRAEQLGREHRVRFDFGSKVGTGATALDVGIGRLLRDAGAAIGVSPHPMPTVGHDAAMFARRGIPTGMVLVRNANGSHNAEEAMSMDDFATGLRVLIEAVVAIANAGLQQ